jgi:photosynthetic reaction center cytochrome c subunit
MRPHALTLLATGGLLLAIGCERPPVDAVQTGFRGVGMEHIANPRTVADSMAAFAARVPTLAGQPPVDMEPAPPGTWENVQVLGHLSEGEFNRLMLAMTTWVAQETGQGCNYCHVIEDDGQVNFVSDDIYTKVVSRDMIRMTQEINANYASHVGEAGVNCWTCHMGQVLPPNYWFLQPEVPEAVSPYFVNQGPRQLERYYLDDDAIRVISEDAALSGDTDNTSSIQDTEHAYWVMIQMSKDLGVNCTYCHTTARFGDWEQSSPERVTALRGVRMVRHLNTEYMVPLDGEWPDYRLGPLGDGPKIQCGTCHNGAWQPQYGVPASHGSGWPGLTTLGPAHPGGAEAPSETPADPPGTGPVPGPDQ